MDNKIGILAPSGTFYECESWEHMDKAMEIVQSMPDVPADIKESGLAAEQYLQNRGYVIVRARDVYGMIGWENDEGEVVHLSEIQKKWLIKEYPNFPNDKRECVDDLIDYKDRY